jgi:hypothetical protein
MRAALRGVTRFREGVVGRNGLQDLLAAGFSGRRGDDLWAADLARRLTKWFFEFTRNVMILGAIKYIADVSSSPILDAFYWTALGMMIVYIYSFTNMVLQVRPFAFLEQHGFSHFGSCLQLCSGRGTVFHGARCNTRRHQ